MNKIFKRVWDAKLGQLVVASEFARSRCKKGSNASTRVTRGKKIATTLLLTMGTVGMVSLPLSALAYNAGGGDDGDANQSIFNVAIGQGAKIGSGTWNSVVLGQTATIGPEVWNSVALGPKVTVSTPFSVGLGSNVTVEGNSAVAIGYASKALTNRSIAIGDSATTNSKRDIAIGTDAITGSVSGATIGQLDNIAFGTDTVATGGGSVAIGQGTLATGTNTAGNNNALAIGSQAEVHDYNGVALGTSATTGVGSTYVTAIGSRAQIADNASGAVAIGSDAKVAEGAGRALAMGMFSTAAKYGASALGTSASASGQYSVAVGANSAADNTASIAIGNNAEAEGSKKVSAIAIGNGAKSSGETGSGKGYGGTIALGDHAETKGYKYATAIGYNAITQGDSSIALGNQAEATGFKAGGAIAVGGKSRALAAKSVAMGLNSYVSDGGNSGVAIGESAKVESGVEGTDGQEHQAGNIAGAAYGIAIGQNSRVVNDHGISIGDGAGSLRANLTPEEIAKLNHAQATFVGGLSGNSTLSAQASTGIGYDALSASDEAAYATAVGNNAGRYMDGKYNTAVGHAAGMGWNVDRPYIGDKNTSLGNEAGRGATGSHNLYVGNETSAGTGDAANPSRAHGSRNVMLGSKSSILLSQDDNPVEINDAVGVGYGTKVNVSGGVALGSGSTADRAALTNVSTSTDAKASDNTVYASDAADNSAKDRIIATVANSRAAISLGGEDDEGNPTTRQITNLAAGSEDTDAVNVAQLKSSVASGSTHYYSVNDNGVQQDNYNNDGATGLNALAAGVGASATGDSAIAIGHEATAKRTRDIAIGRNAATGELSDYTGTLGQRNNLAFGTNAKAIGGGSIAIGREALATGSNTVSDNNTLAIGTLAKVQDFNGTAIGAWATTGIHSPYATAIGSTATVADNTYFGTALGSSSYVSGNFGIALGYDSHATAIWTTAVGMGSHATGSKSIAMGRTAATGADAISIGTSTRGIDNTLPVDQQFTVGGAFGDRSIAIGKDARAKGNYTLAMGNDGTIGAAAEGDNSIALGGASVAGSTMAGEAVAIGHGAQATGKDSIAVGTGNKVSGDHSGAFGDPSIIDAANSYSVGNNNTIDTGADNSFAMGNGIELDKKNALALGNGAYAAENAQAVGEGARAEGKHSFAAGDGATAKGDGNIAVGYGASTSGKAQQTAVGRNASVAGSQSTAVGNEATTGARDATAVGSLARALGQKSVSIGQDSQADGKKSVALGEEAWVKAEGGMALGSGSIVEQKNSVALGTGSEALELQHTGNFSMGNEPVAGLSDGTAAVVSVGKEGAERQIQNVAPGVVSSTSTDAINGSQLYATNKTMIEVLGDGGEIDDDGNIVKPEFPLYNYRGELVTSNTVYDALKVAQTHYYSVNDNGVQQDNYNNDGATGVNALAAGVNTTAAGRSSVAMGHGASAKGIGAVAIGQSAKSTRDENTVIGRGAEDAGYQGTFIGAHAAANATTVPTQFGNATVIGMNAAKDAKLGLLDVYVGDRAGQDALANTTGANTAMGGSAARESKGDFNTAFGYWAGHNIDASNATSLGTQAQAFNDYDVALGAESVSDEVHKGVYSLNKDAEVAGLDGDHQAVLSLGGKNSITGTTTYRQIQNVAPGVISADSTDAINGSQLYYTNANFEGLLGENVTYGDDGLVKWNDYFDGIFGEGSNIGSLADALKPWTITANDETPGVKNKVLPGDNVDISGGVVSSGSGNSGGGNTGGGSGDSNIDVGLDNKDPDSNGNRDHDITLDLADDVKIDNSLTVGDPDGGDAYVTMGEDGDKGSDGAITQYGKEDSDGNRPIASQTVEKGPGGVGADQDENGMTRQTYTDENGDKHTVATLDDGLTFGANDGDDHDAHLNTKVNVKGDDANTDFSKFDGGKNIMTKMEDNTVRVALSNDLEVDSVTAKNKIVAGDENGNHSTLDSEGVTVNDSNGGSTNYGSDGMTIQGGPSVTKNGVDAGGKRVQNMAAGEANSDGATVGQLRDSMQDNRDWSKNYTDQRVGRLQRRMHRNDRNNRAGIASAVAIASMPQAYDPGLSSFNVGVGSHRGENAMAIGLSTVTDSGRYMFKVNASADSRGHSTFGAGMGVVW